MEVITEGVSNINISDSSSANKKNRIQVSNTKKPLFFYVNLAKVLFLCLSIPFMVASCSVAENFGINGIK